MPSYNTNQLRNGVKLLIDGEPCNILDIDFVKPGKGQAFARVKTRNLLTGRVLEKTYKSSETLEGADVLETNMQYLYNDGEYWHFMDPSSYEQYQADANATSEAAPWILPEDVCAVTLWNNVPIAVNPPNFVELVITQSDPGVRGDTSSGGTKPATLQTGAVVKVPLFVQEGEKIRVDTRTGDYVSRA